MAHSSFSQLRRIVLIFTLLIATVGCDQASKLVARKVLSTPLSYWNNVLVFEHAENPGAFLSLGAGLTDTVRFWIFTVVVFLILAGILFYILRKPVLPLSETVAMTLIVGGGIGNLMDRMSRGTVTDFINLGWGSWRTGIFNLADMAIVAGVAWLTMESLVRWAKSHPSSSE